MSILIVDDDADIRLVARLTIERLVGRPVRDAGGLRAGLAALSAGPAPDLVVCDCRLGDGEGADLLAAVRSAPATRHLPVLMLTAAADEEGEALLAAGATEVIGKPFTPASLAAAVARHLPPR